MDPERTPEGREVLYLRATGVRFERWPVDARDMLATGAYTADPSEVGTVAPAAPVSAPSEPVPLTQYAPGVPLVVTKSEDAPPGKPTAIPTGHTSHGKRGR